MKNKTYPICKDKTRGVAEFSHQLSEHCEEMSGNVEIQDGKIFWPTRAQVSGCLKTFLCTEGLHNSQICQQTARRNSNDMVAKAEYKRFNGKEFLLAANQINYAFHQVHTIVGDLGHEDVIIPTPFWALQWKEKGECKKGANQSWYSVRLLFPHKNTTTCAAAEIIITSTIVSNHRYA